MPAAGGTGLRDPRLLRAAPGSSGPAVPLGFSFLPEKRNNFQILNYSRESESSATCPSGLGDTAWLTRESPSETGHASQTSHHSGRSLLDARVSRHLLGCLTAGLGSGPMSGPPQDRPSPPQFPGSPFTQDARPAPVASRFLLQLLRWSSGVPACWLCSEVPCRPPGFTWSSCVSCTPFCPPSPPECARGPRHLGWPSPDT